MPNFSKAFSVLSKNYVEVPLEIFSSDPYKTLVSTILSARTNDDTTLVRCKILFQKAPNIYELKKLTEASISQLIYPVGFYKNKAKFLVKLADTIVNQYSGEIPETKLQLMSLPGVGEKTANLVLNRAFGIPAIAVDTHVHRITNMLGWVNSKNPTETQKQLEKILPKKYWSDTNRLFVSIGRQYRSKKKLAEFLKNQGLL